MQWRSTRHEPLFSSVGASEPACGVLRMAIPSVDGRRGEDPCPWHQGRGQAQSARTCSAIPIATSPTMFSPTARDGVLVAASTSAAALRSAGRRQICADDRRAIQPQHAIDQCHRPARPAHSLLGAVRTGDDGLGGDYRWHRAATADTCCADRNALVLMPPCGRRFAVSALGKIARVAQPQAEQPLALTADGQTCLVFRSFFCPTPITVSGTACAPCRR